ncbi:MAG: nucleotidyltransferase domain-containing protein [Pirellulales bacterium]|nr:nucleotidyltransferase domain-containing protein [Pirellulales bacterium]
MVTPVLDKQDLLERLQDVREEIRARGVIKLGLFGSFARDASSTKSDVDLLVQFDPPRKSFDNFMHLSFLLEDVLQRPVELVTTEGMSPFLRPRILAELEDVPLVE